MLKAIIFDNWNTLVQAPDLMKSGASVQIFLESLAKSGINIDHSVFTEIYRPIARAQVFEAEANGWTELDYVKRLRMVLEKLEIEEPQRSLLANSAWSDYMKEWPIQTTFYPETPMLLRNLKGRVKLGLLTNFMDGPTARVVFNKLGYERFFDSIVVSAEEGYLKPSPILYRKTLEQLGVRSDECAMVGDTYSTDIQGANNVGMRGILIDWEWNQGDQHEHCHRVIRSIGEFTHIFESLL